MIKCLFQSNDDVVNGTLDVINGVDDIIIIGVDEVRASGIFVVHSICATIIAINKDNTKTNKYFILTDFFFFL